VGVNLIYNPTEKGVSLFRHIYIGIRAIILVMPRIHKESYFGARIVHSRKSVAGFQLSRRSGQLLHFSDMRAWYDYAQPNLLYLILNRLMQGNPREIMAGGLFKVAKEVI